MAEHLRQVNFFRLLVVVCGSLLASAALFENVEAITKREIFNALIQAGIVAVAFLQCPNLPKFRKPKGEDE